MEQMHPESRPETSVEKIIGDLEEFYEIKLEKSPEIIFINSRKQMNELMGRETPDWLVANANPSTGQIHILSEDKFKTESNHPREDFPRTLKHEISHNFYNQITGGVLPIWLNEGISLYVAKQIKKFPKDAEWDVDYYFDHAGAGVYDHSFYLVSYLIDTFGKEKILELITSIKPGLDRNKFNNLFESTYDFNMDNDKVREIYNILLLKMK